MAFQYRKPILSQPRLIPHGGAVGGIPESLFRAGDEAAFIIEFIIRRQLFGHGYRVLQSDYFDRMPYGSGVFLQPLVPTHEIFPGVYRPGDIDLLVIPYEENELVLERTMAIEFKVIRRPSGARANRLMTLVIHRRWRCWRAEFLMPL